MLIFGDYTCLPTPEIRSYLQKNGIAVFNFSSFVSDCPQVTNLLPRKEGVDCSFPDEEFDMKYFDYIINNDYPFIEFMLIINELFKGSVVYILINHGALFDKLAESLAEIIKQRYGYISFFINEMDDYEWVINNLDSVNFSAIGVNNYDMDRQKFISVMQSKGLLPREE